MIAECPRGWKNLPTVSLLYSIFVGGLSGLLAALIALPLSKLFKGNKSSIAYSIFLVLGFMAFNSLGRFYVLPRIEVWSVERELKNIPVYKVISETDPATFEQISDELQSYVLNKQSKDVILEKIKGKVETLVFKYIPRASDQAAKQYMKVTVDELKQVSNKDPGICLQALFPDKLGFADITPFIDKGTQEADLNALKTVIETAVKTPNAPPDPKVVEKLLEKVTPQMEQEYGDKMNFLNRIDDPTIDKKEACLMVIAFYEKIFALPDEESGPLLRGILAPAK